MEIGRNRTNSIRSFPNLPLESVRNTESDSFVHHTGKGRWPKNVMQEQGVRIQLRHTSSWDDQSGTCRDEVQSPFQPIEKPSTHSESPTGLHKPPPIAFSKWSRLHGFPDAPDKEIETYFRPSLVKKVVRSQKRETTKSPEVRNALSSNSIYERDSNALWKKMFPNTSESDSDTAMHRIQFSSSEESCGEEFPSFCSSSDHTIVGRQSTTTDHTVTEERLAARNVSGGPTSSSGSVRAPRDTRDSPASSSGSLCTAQLVSRSQTSEEDNYYMVPQNNYHQIPYSNIDKAGVFPGGSLSTNSSYESTVDGPIGTSTRNSTGRTSGTLSTQSSLYSVTNDVMMRKNSPSDAMMRKNSPSPLPSETNGYLDKIQNEAHDQTKHFAKIGSYYKQCYDHSKDLVECIDRCNLLAANENCLNMIFKANWIRTVMGLNRQDPLNLHIPDSRYLTAKENSNNSTNHINNNATPVDGMDISFGSIESYDKYAMYNESFTGSRNSWEQPSPSLENSERNSIRDEDFAKKHKTYQIPKPDLNENSMVVLDQKLYVIGGLRYNDDNPLPRRDVWVYYPERGWRKLTSLRTARVHHALCVFDGCIYAIGGLGRNGRILKSVECYNPSTNSWHFVKSVSTPRAGACAAELNGNIFVAGGFGYSQNGTSTIFDSVECYRGFTDKWITKGSLRYGRCHATMTCVENSLYLSGGLAFDKNSSVALSVQEVDLYDANNDSWMLRTCMDKARHSAASFASGNKMYLIGGLATNTKENLHDDIECLDVQRNAWLSTFKLPIEVQWMKGLA